jgi:hypothetical protein
VDWRSRYPTATSSTSCHVSSGEGETTHDRHVLLLGPFRRADTDDEMAQSAGKGGSKRKYDTTMCIFSCEKRSKIDPFMFCMWCNHAIHLCRGVKGKKRDFAMACTIRIEILYCIILYFDCIGFILTETCPSLS